MINRIYPVHTQTMIDIGITKEGVMEIYTIGFTQKGAKKFFELLNEAEIERLVDVRLRNRSQLSGFAKRDDLKFFLENLGSIEYDHMPELAPTDELLDDWRDDDIDWSTYEERFRSLIAERNIESRLDQESFESPTVLLCSEHEPELCHRRLVIEYLDDRWGNIKPIHLT